MIIKVSDGKIYCLHRLDLVMPLPVPFIWSCHLLLNFPMSCLPHNLNNFLTVQGVFDPSSSPGVESTHCLPQTYFIICSSFQCHSSGNYTLAFLQALGSVLDDIMWDSWWMKWHWSRFFSNPPPPPIIMPPLLHTHISLPPEVCSNPDQAAHYHCISL
jgi:hypothetical protein